MKDESVSGKLNSFLFILAPSAFIFAFPANSKAPGEHPREQSFI
jgi:hypothetical protein